MKTLWRALGAVCVTVSAARAQIVTGTIRDSASGAPLSHIEVLWPDGRARPSTDSSGKFSAMGILAGAYLIEVRADSTMPVAWSRTIGVTVTESQPMEVRIPLVSVIQSAVCPSLSDTGRNAAIIGRLPARAPIPVAAEWLDSDGKTLRAMSRTSSQGMFRFCSIPSATAVRVSAEVDGRQWKGTASWQMGMRVAALVSAAVGNGGRLSGRVLTAAAVPVEAAAVTLADERRTETTDAEGRFEFRGLAAKRYEVIVRKLGYVFADTVVEIADEENRSIQVRLVRGTNLDSVSVRERGGMMSSFDEHRKIGLGQFLTREELDKVRGAMLGSVLSQFRGTKIMVGRGNYSAVASSRGGTSLNGDGLRGLKPACYSTVILDNMVVYSEKAGRPGNQALFMINEMSPDQLEGVEFYQGPAQIPDRYSGLDLSCGLLVLWTRRTFAP